MSRPLQKIKLRVTHNESIRQVLINEMLSVNWHHIDLEFIYACLFDENGTVIPNSEFDHLEYLVQDGKEELEDQSAWEHLLTTIPVKGGLLCERFRQCRCQDVCVKFDPNIIYCTMYEEVIRDAVDHT